MNFGRSVHARVFKRNLKEWDLGIKIPETPLKTIASVLWRNSFLLHSCILPQNCRILGGWVSGLRPTTNETDLIVTLKKTQQPNSLCEKLPQIFWQHLPVW